MEIDAQITQDQAAGELLRRQRARESLVEYARSVDIPGAPISDDPEAELFKPIETAVADHHRVTLEAIQRTVTRKRGRLMIFEPPGSGKSSYGSVVTPSWCMQKWEGYRIILAGYGLDISSRHSRKARALCRSPRSQAIWPHRPTLSTEQRAVDDWSLSNGSNFMAAGFQTGITGNRADGLIVDDPVKNREQADSPTVREKVKEEFRESAKTRLKPNGWIILIQTRWHEDDLAGSILPENYAGESGMIKCRDGQMWEVLNIPAKAEYADDPLGRPLGEYLWPEWFGPEHWAEFENDPQGKRTWSALFQQRPTAGDGLEFTREMFRWYNPDARPDSEQYALYGLPRLGQLCGASDTATKEDKSDFTEHCIGGLSQADDLYITDWWYGQKTSDIWIDASIALMRRHKPLRWAHEGGVIESAVMPAWRKAMRAGPAPVFTIFEPMTSIKNKAVKLTTLQAWAAAGRVWLPLNRAWAQRVVDQLCGFPAARYDDAADCIGLLARLLDKMIRARAQSAHSRPLLVPFTAAWVEFNEHSEQRIRYS